MYQYNQGLQIFMVCTYLFVIFGSNIQCTVLRRRISAFINNRKSIEGMTKFIHKIKCICLDILSTWAYIRRCTELPEYFFFTLFFHFLLHHTMYSHGGCLSTCSSMIKKSWTVPNLGVIVFAHTRIPRDVRLWEMRFSYISRYTQYISRYTNMGKLSRGSGFQIKSSWKHKVSIPPRVMYKTRFQNFCPFSSPPRLSKWFRLIRWSVLLHVGAVSSCCWIQQPIFLLPSNVLLLVRSVRRVCGHCSHFRMARN